MRDDLIGDALLARAYKSDRCRQALLSLATDAIQGVQIAVFAAAKYYAATEPRFYWVLLDLVLQQCVVNRDDIPDYHSVVWEEREAYSKLALLDRAEANLDETSTPILPTIPMPWVQADQALRQGWRKTQGYARNDTVFLYNLAAKILPHICLEPIFAEARRREEFLNLVRELLEFTFQEISPPFAKSKRDYDGHMPYEWVFQFSEWCGTLCSYLPRTESKERIIARIWEQDTDTALLILQNLMRSFMIDAFLLAKEVKDELVTLWTEMAEWLFSSPEWKHNRKGDHLDREFTGCALTSLFCVAPDFSPLICGVDPGWPHLHKFLPIIKRAICEFGTNITLYLAVTTFLKKGGIDLLPDPALAWLREVVTSRKNDQKFWELNGENTVEVLKTLGAQKGSLLTSEHQKLIKSIADMLIDNGVRGAGFLQQELLRANPRLTP
jgi:hypothetical protein